MEEFELPPLREDEILGRIVSDSVCMSSHKAAIQGGAHKRVPGDVENNPVIIGHEFCGEIIEVGAKWKDRYEKGGKFSIQPAMNYKGSLSAPGYSYQYIGGDATYVNIPNEVMETDCLLEYSGDAFFYGSLAEPMSCIVGAFHANYHHPVQGRYEHEMGIKDGGSLAVLAGVGPMGLGAIDYALHAERKPSLLVVTDIDESRLERAREIFTPKTAEAAGVKLVFVNTSKAADPAAEICAINGGKGYDDVFVFAPVRQVVEQGDALLGRDGCLNFFAGPTDPAFSAPFNFYNVHYEFHHIVGTSGGNTQDMREALKLMEEKVINPVPMITHVGGLDAAADTVINLPSIPGGKKLIYTGIEMPLTAIEDFRREAGKNPLFGELAEITEANNGLWCLEAENHLLKKLA